MKNIYGINPISEILKITNDGVLFLIEGALNARQKELETIALSKEINIQYLNKDDFFKRFTNNDTQGVVFQTNNDINFEIPENQFYDELNKSLDNPVILILDGIKDIGNLGGMIRTALLFDVKYIVIPKNNAATVNEVVIKRSAGAVFKLKIVYATNLNRVMEKLKKIHYWIYGADMSGVSIKNFSYAERTAIVMGDEGEGIRRLVKENCDEMIKIPSNEKLDSLNVSVSAGIILYDRYIKSFK
ncbi:MAG: 23S rRNA (guanosine(2251)-2'-O)-methyltransferase RlmB [Spirochaetes bacterium GWF1_31_7]|nr:MAG: 23S rRNA (guanosine(2251)-2'-O)-methyltransferase RlmB [Spirochaetes bacterium GWE1_32_154]OHD46612.1 MAG: 23S rRNA (guanosine(2251)-2'-O)-methyltransferase RlmB [Spirochaetes bacterium GWE2_31_10]OHD47626.1 MAG: 23S rRNA (guanosine(2251)-2'-O)-methyltransferase RlmB [Spirochaetes bacterium GWF1_31_7]OHD74022.1 MAG: 23S rRNA (guanosine(2251)-2'-O)-methyltransferase RlmB [Spirochaetes bacterium RIFOXYB1_FULL_32_8]HBD94403.1 23S rRNA (guanosine(2251)-2'-O)-methyltransferase RlmB [Spirocha